MRQVDISSTKLKKSKKSKTSVRKTLKTITNCVSKRIFTNVSLSPPSFIVLKFHFNMLYKVCIS